MLLALLGLRARLGPRWPRWLRWLRWLRTHTRLSLRLVDRHLYAVALIQVGQRLFGYFELNRLTTLHLQLDGIVLVVHIRHGGVDGIAGTHSTHL